MDDLVLRGGTVVDGTGGPPRTADVAIVDGLVKEIGAVSRGSARRVVDVSGAVVAPGFIDLHSHADYSLFGAPAAPSQVHQGVTTLVTGNCGFSPFPVVAEYAEDMRRHRVLGDDALPWSWHTTSEFLASVDRLPLGVNVACLVGHGALRIAALGTARRSATPEEVATMRSLLREAVDAGVVGLSSGLIYAPGSFADRAELVELCQELAGTGLLYSSHVRNEADQHAGAISEALETARLSGAKLEVSHVKSIGSDNWGGVRAALAAIDAAARDGLDAAADAYPYAATSTALTSRLPDWALDGGISELLRRLADPAISAQIAGELSATGGRALNPDSVVISTVSPGTYDDVPGMTVTEVARRLDLTPPEAVLELLRAHDASVRIVNHALSEDDVQAALRHPMVSVASDGYVLAATGTGRPHPRSFGTFTRVLGRYVRDLDILDLAEAVRKMTGLPASRLGWTSRGALRPGTVADICVFDPASVQDNSTFDDPWQLSTGVLHTLVAGYAVLEDGQPTGAGPGRVLRGAVGSPASR